MGLFPVPGALLAEDRHGPHRADETSRIGVDEHRRAVPGQGGIDHRREVPRCRTASAAPRPASIRSLASSGRTRPICAATSARTSGRSSWAMIVGLSSTRGSRQLVTVEDLQPPVQRVVSHLVEDCIDERLGRDQLDLGTRVPQHPDREFTDERAARYCVDHRPVRGCLQNPIRDRPIHLVEGFVRQVEVVTGDRPPSSAASCSAAGCCSVRTINGPAGIEQDRADSRRNPVEIAGAQTGDRYHSAGGTTCGCRGRLPRAIGLVDASPRLPRTAR